MRVVRLWKPDIDFGAAPVARAITSSRAQGRVPSLLVLGNAIWLGDVQYNQIGNVSRHLSSRALTDMDLKVFGNGDVASLSEASMEPLPTSNSPKSVDRLDAGLRSSDHCE